ncbi:Hypothetical protein AJAP_24325 [Amycolatopsis japonica]|uniref:Uncharacterized protein n=1 Tax=Amycolatopsis japonica TaxID=208439 RepID=A0A075UZ81_9PSEU|nr:Hypothetical protein AJAP_24325 [Amycolatopsis japonica]
MPDPSRSTRPATADTRSKGSDHDHHHADEPEAGHGTADGRPNTPDGDHADGPQDADQPNTDSPRDGGQGTASRAAERGVDGSTSPLAGRPDVGRVMLKTTPEGAAWVLVEGSDFAELAERINAVYDALTRRPR